MQTRQLNLVALGHIDSGKSTLTGRLLQRFGCFTEEELEETRKTAEELGKGSYKYAFLTDIHLDERHRGVTMIGKTIPVEIGKWKYFVHAASGHRDFLHNVLLKAFLSDVSIVVVPVDNLSMMFDSERGFGKTMLQVVMFLKPQNACILINKMDLRMPMTSYDAKQQFNSLLQQHDIQTDIPIIAGSAWTGSNVIDSCEEEPTNGCTVTPNLSDDKVIINSVESYLKYAVKEPDTSKLLTEPLKLIISESTSNRDNSTFRVFGKIVSGYLTVGDRVQIITRRFSRQETFTVKTIMWGKEKSVNIATVNAFVSIELSKKVYKLKKCVLPNGGAVLLSSDSQFVTSQKIRVKTVKFHDNIKLIPGKTRFTALCGGFKMLLRVIAIDDVIIDFESLQEGGIVATVDDVHSKMFLLTSGLIALGGDVIEILEPFTDSTRIPIK